MSAFQFFSIIVTVAALFGLVSVRVLRLPASVGSMGLASLSALALGIAGHFNPDLRTFALHLFELVDFRNLVLHGLLAFLLFAGALHLDLKELRRQKLPVILLATLGTVLSAGLTGLLLFALLHAVGLHLSLPLCLLFGALISPTDPIAVLEMLHRTHAPASLQTLLGGESLFNDGVGAVLFFTVLDWIDSQIQPVSSPAGTAHLSILHVLATHILIQACGGLLLGAALGYLTYYLLRSIDHYSIEVLLTLALATGGYALADALHLSAPLEVVAAGLLANSHGRAHAMSDRTLRKVDEFWSLLDEMLNVVLFLLLGFALILVPPSLPLLIAGAIAIPVVLLARNLSLILLIPLHHRERRQLLHPRPRKPGQPPPPELLPLRSKWLVLGWGGLRGALSVALVLSLVNHPGSRPLFAITYTVVAFSVLVQGLSMPRLLHRLGLARQAASPSTTEAPSHA